MLLEGSIPELMVKVAPKIYQKYVIMIVQGKPHLYVQMPKLLYGLLCDALMLYGKLAKNLETYGFQINLYYLFVAKK